MSDQKVEAIGGAFFGGFFGMLSLFAVGLCCLFLWGCPNYRVYEQGLAGQAKLKESESSRQVLIQDAISKEEAAKHLARAEVERAKGVAEANKIIGEGLKNNHEYLMYLWIHGMADQHNQIVYVPTEAGLPILEAGRFKMPVAK